MGQTLNKATLLEIEVDVHTIDEQRKIVELLNLVGEIIYKRNTQLSKLGDILRARFVEMFGGPVRNSKYLPVLPMTEVCEIIDGDRGKDYLKQEEFFEDEYCLFLNTKNVTSQ